jgi:beta-lactamase superfamily II metal-dependent hydrolase
MPKTSTTSPGDKASPEKAPRDYRVRIRMYRQGLGDCFLLSFPTTDGHKHVMIDCGVVLGTKTPAEPMKKVAQNLFEDTGGKIDVLVITHEHWDHLSGFSPGQAQAELDRINFNQLWLAWTEDENNDLANALKKERALKKAAAIATKKKLAELGDKAEKSLKRLTALMEFNGDGDDDVEGGEEDGGTAGALKFLKKKISRQQILKPGQAPITIPGLDDVRIYVMGPPEDKAKLHKKQPRKGQGYGVSEAMSLSEAFTAALSPEEEVSERAQPFTKTFRKPWSELKQNRPYGKPENAWRNIDDDWLSVGERLALQLDSDTNNTSLVLAFEFIKSEQVLLFVGDAQAGNWMSWDDYIWEVTDKSGGKQKVTAADLLAKTIFYKVGHHGSHNATLREKGLERMTHPELVAMMPVNEKVAHETKGWLHMPLPTLCDRLKEKCAAFIRSDLDEIVGTNPGSARVKAASGKDSLYFDHFV